MQRQNDGVLEPFPIWDDVRTFDGTAWNGIVDVVSAGFPCQPFSVAWPQLREHDERNMWPETIRIIREVGPGFAFLENVSALLACEYFGKILGDLAESGFDARWEVLPAAASGAPHFRARVFLVATAKNLEHSVCPRLQGLHETGWRKHLQSVAGNLSEHIWSATPRVCVRGDGVPSRMDQLRAIGNGQVPAVVRAAWRLLSGQQSLTTASPEPERKNG